VPFFNVFGMTRPLAGIETRDPLHWERALYH